MYMCVCGYVFVCIMYFYVCVGRPTYNRVCMFMYCMYVYVCMCMYIGGAPSVITPKANYRYFL